MLALCEVVAVHGKKYEVELEEKAESMHGWSQHRINEKETRTTVRMMPTVTASHPWTHDVTPLDTRRHAPGHTTSRPWAHDVTPLMIIIIIIQIISC